MKTIKLSNGEATLVDDEDYERFGHYKWSSSKGYAIRGQRLEGGNKINYYLHREIMGNPEGRTVDHINGNPQDCRRSNLRICSSADNQANRRPQKNSTSKYKGVSYCKETNRYRAEIVRLNVKYYLGRFDDAILAALAYDEAARKLCGEFAYQNFPDSRKAA